MKSTFTGIKSIEDFDLKDQRVFLRLDLNVPIKNGNITDTTRIDAALPTIKYALEHGAKLVVASHLGRPVSEADRAKYSMEPVADKLGKLLNCEVILVEEPESEAPKALLRGLKPKQFILLENLRFNKDETENGDSLTDAICEYTDIYINDAFGASHRAHSSIVGVPTKVPRHGIGFLMKKEIEMLDKVMQNPESPFAIILGGAKVSDKMGVIENIIDRVDTILVGGAMAYTFLAAQEVPVGNSRVEKDRIKYAHDLLERMKMRGKRMFLPVDHCVVAKLENTSEVTVTSDAAIGAGLLGVDIGPKTIELFRKEIMSAKTVFWNGPMGIFETPAYAKGTFAIAKMLSELKDATTIVGGGDSAAAIKASGFADKVTHISTGGGASLEFLQGDKLPGVEALRDRKA
ncbi:MAG: phosphoglycerate kinase [Bdellovibrionales bacterium RBG_16_40_8]|nr:MAG: phosphoglycerate kinase [Bdellovibrionales bacterium RBG_16_40_8]